MSQDQKFLQRWEFRSRDDDLDSSSEDSKSSSSGKAVLKKHELVSKLILPENDETINTPLFQQESEKGHDRVPFEFGKAHKMHIGRRKKNNAVKNKIKTDSMKKSNRKKNDHLKHEPVLLDDFKIFMESIIEELQVARENSFTWMIEEMKKLVPVELASSRQGKKVVAWRKLAKSVKSDKTTDSNNCLEVLEERVNPDRAIGTITSNEKGKVERSRLSVKKPICSSSNLSDPVTTSPYLTSPTVLSEPRVENHRLGSSPNLVIDASTHRGYFSINHQEGQFGSFSQMGSQNMDCFYWYNAQTSTMGTRFPVPLHQGLGNGFNTPSQAVLENSSCDSNSLGLQMSGGAIRFSGASHALSEHFVANFPSQLSYKTEGRLLACERQDQKDGNLYSN
ncbi:unnamed protein product [Camellia sinensis]